MTMATAAEPAARYVGHVVERSNRVIDVRSTPSRRSSRIEWTQPSERAARDAMRIQNRQPRPSADSVRAEDERWLREEVLIRQLGAGAPRRQADERGELD